MDGTTMNALMRSLAAVAAAALFTGCADEAPLGPARRPAFPAQPALVAPAGARAPDLEGCEKLQVQAGSTLALRAYARGVQIYRWNGTSWSFLAPSAVLFADAGEHSRIGVHYAGPTWLSVSGSKVVGAVLERCSPDANAIPWLLLEVVSHDGRGVFTRTAFIQRVNTVGGQAPSDNGSFTGEEVSVPYTAEYLFYRSR